MRQYAVADSGKGWHWSQQLALEAVTIVVTVILMALLLSLGEKGLTTAIVAAPLVTLAIFWRSIVGDSKKALAERGRYYCSKCWQHFEGDALRQITQ